MTVATVSPTVLARPSGGYAMLAVDQREALRAMFAAHQSQPVTDEQITAFKVAAARALSPHASAILVDKQFGWDAVIAEEAVAAECALIAAADRFTASATEFVADVAIDDDVDPAAVRAQGAKALKLLVLWRPDEDPAPRIALVTDFVRRCRDNGLVSIIEPVSRAPARAAPSTTTPASSPPPGNSARSAPTSTRPRSPPPGRAPRRRSSPAAPG